MLNLSLSFNNPFLISPQVLVNVAGVTEATASEILFFSCSMFNFKHFCFDITPHEEIKWGQVGCSWGPRWGTVSANPAAGEDSVEAPVDWGFIQQEPNSLLFVLKFGNNLSIQHK